MSSSILLEKISNISFSTLRTEITDTASLSDIGISVKAVADVRCNIIAVLEYEYDRGLSRNSDRTLDLIADLQDVAKK